MNMLWSTSPISLSYLSLACSVCWWPGSDNFRRRSEYTPNGSRPPYWSKLQWPLHAHCCFPLLSSTAKNEDIQRVMYHPLITLSSIPKMIIVSTLHHIIRYLYLIFGKTMITSNAIFIWFKNKVLLNHIKKATIKRL